MRPDEHADRLARITTALVAWVARRPRAVLFACFVLAAGAVALSYAKLEYHTQRNDLLSADKACQKRWQKYLDAFGDDDDMVVVAEGTDREQMKAALDDVAAEVRKRPELFDRTFHRADLRPLADRALLYLPPEQIEAIRDRVGRMDPLLGDFGPLAWKKISAQSLLGNGGVALEKRAAGRELTAAERDLIALLPTIVSSAAATVRDPAAYRSPWAVSEENPSPQPPPPEGEGEKNLRNAATSPDAREATHAGAPSPPGGGGWGRGSSLSQLTEPQYFFTPDGSLAMLTCRPKKVAESFTPAKEANEAMRAILADVSARHPHVQLGLTGLPVLETDEMVMSDVDSTRASWLALAGVAVLYFVVYRGFRYPLLTVGSLVVGTVWALGWATLTVGHLNILSATFAVMLIGLGDYGVLWVAQYDEQRKLGCDANDAMRYTAAHAGPSVLVAALGTSLAFFATMLADFKAVAELGWIAGCGVLFCALACLTALPAALVLLERRRAKQPDPPSPFPKKEGGGADNYESSRAGNGCDVTPRPELPGLSDPAPPPSFLGKGDGGVGPPLILPFPATFLPALAARPRLVLAVGALLLLVCAGSACRIEYDHNLLNLQARGTDSVEWERKLISRAAGATWDAMSVARSREEAFALKAKYEALPEVAKVVEVASLVPDRQGQKLPAVAAIHARLANLPPKERLPVPNGSDPVAVRELAERVGRLAGTDTALVRATADLARAAAETPDAAVRLRDFDRRLAADLATELHSLKGVSRPAPITLADVPVELRERFVGANGEYLVRAFAKESLWDYAALQKFTAAARTADPEATGKSFRTLEGLRQMRSGFEWAGVYALGAIVLVLALDFRSATGLLLALFPLAAGVVFTLGLMALCGVPLNPANMIALPLIVGVGVDNGVHVLHDHRARDRRRAYRLGAATGRGVLVAGLTTVLGFGTMLIARHAGMAGLGLALTIGVSCCMAAALLLLPAALHLRDRARLVKRERAPVATRAAVLPFETARAA
ncbi:MAG: MMPL family transporter [Planctomycetes bacterium]|nr:MMPL family transporter [Planctomycetota bacterium]